MPVVGTTRRANGRWVVLLSGAVVLMFGFGYALVPLYDLFCEITGVGGKPTIAVEQQQQAIIEARREVTVEFTATANQNMPWTITPLVRKTKVNPGVIHEVNYLVKNTSKQPMVGQAIPSISPMQAAKNLVKLECFCFDAQTLAAGEMREMPVRFYINSKLSDEINTLTLSYSFFPLGQPIDTMAQQANS